MNKDMKIYFVLPSDYEDELATSEAMQQAFELCRQNKIIPEWISEENCLTKNFRKEDIVVFEKFEGETFQKVQTRLSIVGPWCIITSLLDGLQVPNNKSPLYNMAMHNLIVAASNYTPDEKKIMKERVEMMGGVFILHVTSNSTHLITNSVRTQKYAAANAKGVSVMLSSWVEDVWNSSLTRNVKATDAEFDKHKCPCFQNLRMCSTGFELSERNELQKLITQNGGTYSGKLLTSTTDILICKPGTKSEKFDVAKKARLPCVRIEWIYDSLKKGYALPDQEYVIRVASSTPTKGDAPLNPDFSMMSIISGNENNDPNKTSVSATLTASMLNVVTPQPRKLTEQKENQEPDVIAEIDLQTVRKAGTFLDGCGVLLAGFSPVRRDKLCRILRSAGATRYDTISDRVTQVLVGDPASHEVRLLDGQAPLVSAAWLIESIRTGQPAPEDPYIIQTGGQSVATPAPSSPLIKKGLTLLQNDTTMIDPEPPNEAQPELEADEHDSIQIYKNNKINTEEDTLAQLLAGADNIHTKCETKTTLSEEDQEQEEEWYAIFENKTFKMIDQTEEDLKKLTAMIEDVGGKIVKNNYKGVTDYAVVPPVVGTVHHAAAEVISCLWILDCFANDELLTPEYYHQLLSIADNAPLQNCVITISGYASLERQFLISLIRGLGAIYQDKFAKIAKEGVLANTHLVCLDEEGSKWEAAKRWKRHIVTHLWLLRCAETGQRVPEEDYLLGKNDSKRAVTVMTPGSVSNKRDFEGRKISPPAATTSINTKSSSKANNTDAPITPAPRNTSTKNKKTEPAANKAEVPVTPAPVNLKRDSDGRRKSPESFLPDGNTSRRISPPTATTSATKFKKTSIARTPVSNHINASMKNEEKPGGNPMITLEDGRVIPLNTYMEELRAEGVYDTPSPLPPAAPGTPIQEIMARLHREGKLATTKGGDTPTRNCSESGSGSQNTPIGRYLRGLQERNVLPSSPKQAGGTATTDSPIPRSVFDVKTPDTPLGRFIEDDPSRSTRKHWKRCLDRIPHYSLHDRPAAPPRRPSTPWSEIKRQAWSWLARDKDGTPVADASSPTPAEDVKHPTLPEPVTESQREVSNKIGQLQDMLKRRESSGPSRSLLLTLDGQGASTSSDPTPSNIDAKDSQTDTVGWDEPMEDCVFSESTGVTSQPRKFMMSAVESAERTNCCNIIRSLGGEVSDLNYFDKTATHVVCSNPSRNEKILSSMAAGLWIMHHSYILQSAAAGRFLPEEEFALGNPKSMTNLATFIDQSPVTEAINWWREHVRKTGKGAFHGMRALIFAKNTEAIVRLIEAGGGTILQASPPFAHSIDITHCFLDAKINPDYSEFIPLAEQGVPCISILYLSNYLSNRTNVNFNEFIMPALRNYYNN